MSILNDMTHSELENLCDSCNARIAGLQQVMDVDAEVLRNPSEHNESARLFAERRYPDMNHQLGRWRAFLEACDAVIRAKFAITG